MGKWPSAWRLGASLTARDALNGGDSLALGGEWKPESGRYRVACPGRRRPWMRGVSAASRHCIERRNSTIVPVIEALLDAGADPMALQNTGMTPLHLAAGWHPNAAVIEFAARCWSRSCGYGTMTAGRRCTGAAAVNRNPDVVEKLLDAGGDLTVQDINGDTPLHWAAENTFESAVIEVLIEAGGGSDGTRPDRGYAAAFSRQPVPRSNRHESPVGRWGGSGSARRAGAIAVASGGRQQP